MFLSGQTYIKEDALTEPVANKEYKNKIQNIDVIQFLKSIKTSNFFDLIIIDPPYNIGKDFGNNSDKQSLADYISWSKQYLRECMRLAKPNAPMYLYGFPEILSHIAVNYPMQNQRWLAWHYTNKTVPTSKFWQRSYESILCLWKQNKPTLNIDDIREEYTKTFLKNSAGKTRKSKYCRYSNGDTETIYSAHDKGALPRDVIKIPALAGGSGSKERVAYCKKCKKLVIGKDKHNHNVANLISHPTQKPLKLTKKLIKGSSPKNILIPFAGSGSECFVAKKMGINFYATELNKDYVKLANVWINTTK
jgi:site-specific DNA-methyltransferase (adenine-specific)